MSHWMSIYALPGHKVRLHAGSAHSGYPTEIKAANRHLTVGGVYTVHRTRVTNSHSWVELEEVPGVSFNTIHFESLIPQTEEQDWQHPAFPPYRKGPFPKDT